MKNISIIKERILQYLDYKRIKKNKFYTLTGIANGTLDKNSGLSSDSIEKIVKVFPEINLRWLITGDGNMLLTEDKSEVKRVEEEIPAYTSTAGLIEAQNNLLKQLLAHLKESSNLKRRQENFEDYVNSVFARIGKKREDINLEEIKRAFFKDNESKTAS